MKKLLLLLPVLGLLLTDCSNEFDVVAPWKEIPVAYAILSPRDTAHYVRVEKAFLDPETSALQIAQIADSLYYPEDAINVYIQRVSNGQLFQLRRVDGNLDGHPRKDGIFATQPNWLYKITNTEIGGLEPRAKYRLVIKRTDGQPDVTAETTIPDNIEIIGPNPTDIPRKLNFFPPNPTNITWYCDANSVLFKVDFNIRYREENANGSLLKRDTLAWDAPFVLELGNGGGVAKIAHTDFYRFLNMNIDSVASPPFRYFEEVIITVTGGGKEIKDLQLTTSANLGITGSEVLPTFTNLSEGFGIFTAKNVGVMTNVRILENTIDAMETDPLTRHLNFRY